MKAHFFIFDTYAVVVYAATEWDAFEHVRGILPPYRPGSGPKHTTKLPEAISIITLEQYKNLKKHI